MKNISLTILLVVALGALAFAAPTLLTQNWRIDGGSQPWFDATDDNVRGLAYNPVTDHVLVAYRNSGDPNFGIVILRASDGVQIGALDTTAIQALGNHYIRRVGVADDGTIYVCNLAVAGANFTIYKFANEAAVGSLISSSTVDQRMGDIFRVAVSGSTTRIFSSGHGTHQMRIWDNTGTLLSVITVASLANAGSGIAPESATGNLWVTYAYTTYWTKIDQTGAILDSITTGVIPLVSSNGIIVPRGTLKCLLTNDAIGDSSTAHGIVVDITGGGSSAHIFAITPNLMVNTPAAPGSTNATFEAAFDSKRGAFIALMETNSIGSYGFDIPIELIDFEAKE